MQINILILAHRPSNNFSFKVQSHPVVEFQSILSFRIDNLAYFEWKNRL